MPSVNCVGRTVNVHDRMMCAKLRKLARERGMGPADVVLFFLRSGCKSPTKGGQHESKAGGRK
jgi:hypothetical protein